MAKKKINIDAAKKLLESGIDVEWVFEQFDLEPVQAGGPYTAKQPVPVPAPIPQPEPKSAETPNAEPTAFPDFSGQVVAMQQAMDSFIQRLQQANINNSTQPGHPEMTTDQILASIIAPPSAK